LVSWSAISVTLGCIAVCVGADFWSVLFSRRLVENFEYVANMRVPSGCPASIAPDQLKAVLACICRGLKSFVQMAVQNRANGPFPSTFCVSVGHSEKSPGQTVLDGDPRPLRWPKLLARPGSSQDRQGISNHIVCGFVEAVIGQEVLEPAHL